MESDSYNISTAIRLMNVNRFGGLGSSSPEAKILRDRLRMLVLFKRKERRKMLIDNY